ncbi:MAG: hypothetical protein Q7S87_05305 [Agitococcus sp.]|nr:hypothetical protein [Agitococcus sp.]
MTGNADYSAERDLNQANISGLNNTANIDSSTTTTNINTNISINVVVNKNTEASSLKLEEFSTLLTEESLKGDYEVILFKPEKMIDGVNEFADSLIDRARTHGLKINIQNDDKLSEEDFPHFNNVDFLRNANSGAFIVILADEKTASQISIFSVVIFEEDLKNIDLIVINFYKDYCSEFIRNGPIKHVTGNGLVKIIDDTNQEKIIADIIERVNSKMALWGRRNRRAK